MIADPLPTVVVVLCLNPARNGVQLLGRWGGRRGTVDDFQVVDVEETGFQNKAKLVLSGAQADIWDSDVDEGVPAG